MDAFTNFVNGTITLFSDPLGIAIFFGGVVGGMLFGAIPGVSMLTLAAILLPFTAHLSAEHGIMPVFGDLLHGRIWRRNYSNLVQQFPVRRKMRQPRLMATQ